MSNPFHFRVFHATNCSAMANATRNVITHNVYLTDMTACPPIESVTLCTTDTASIITATVRLP